MKKLFIDTIVAPATNIGKQAISILRISGEDAFLIINKMLKNPIKKSAGTHLRNIYNDQNEILDQVLLLTFVAPNSFTGEDVVEINCHGGVLVTRKILQLLIANGARMAERGEFSQRAFLNQKISLIQAQGINDLIEAKNDLSLKISAKNMSGKTNDIIELLKNDIIDIISQIQTAIDYPEYEETENITSSEIEKQIVVLENKVKKALKDSQRLQLTKDGIKTAIIGKPNVGKSSLLNAFLKEDKAIVSSEQGTTRDVVEGEIAFPNFTLHLLDTAGIRKTENQIEQAGIKKSLRLAKEAHLVLYLMDGDEEELLEIPKQNALYIINKKDILTSEKINQLQVNWKAYHPIFISAEQNDFDDLIKAIEKKYNMEGFDVANDIILTSADEIAKLTIVQTKINNAITNIKNGFSIDLINIDLREALDYLNALLGLEDMDDEIIDNIFRKYCLGK